MKRAPIPYDWLLLFFTMLLASFVGAREARAATAIQVQVSAASDDAEQDNGGGVQLNNQKLELGPKLWVGFRFNGVQIPQGATITTAYVRLRATDSNSEATQLTVFGQDADTAGTFVSSSNNISSRPRTSASVSWNPVPSWSANTWYQTPEIKTVVQQIANRTGWLHGNSIAILIRSDNVNGKRLATAYDYVPANAAILYVEYTLNAPVGHWKLNQTSGTTANDSSVFARHGTVSGTANWSTYCNGDGTFDFNGSTNYVTITNASQLQPSKALTIAAWVRGDSWGSSTDVDIILRKGGANPNNYGLAISDARVELLLDGNDTSGFRGNTVLTTGVWHHVAATWDGSTVKIYVNGLLDNTPAARTGTIGTNTLSAYIGGTSGADLFDGMMQEVRLYNRALSQTEIAHLAGLPGHWKFSEGSGTTAADSSSAGNNATLSGGATWTTDCAGNNNALVTNGSGGIAQTASAFTPPDAGTVAFWMRSSGTPSGDAPIFGLSDSWEARQFSDGTVAFDLCGNGGTDFATTVPLDQSGTWYHVAATFDSATDAYAIYLDGQLHKSGTNSNAMTQQSAAVLSFGTRTGSSAYWQGALRDFRVYSRKLCPTQIAELSEFVGHWKLDETSGATAADSSGFDRDMTVVGTPTWTTGTVGNCLQLDGTNRAEVVSLLGSPKNITLVGWANLTAADSGGAELISIGDYFAIRLDEGGNSHAIFYNGSSWVSCSVSQIFAGTGWHHFAAVFNDDQNTCKLYVDGVEAASVSTTVTIPYGALGTKTVLGAHGNSSTSCDFTGLLDDIRVYSRALCASEIQILHSGEVAFEGVKIIKWIELQ